MKNSLAEHWENHYQNKNTNWDIGYVSPPIKDYFDQINNKNLSILIPGAGNSYEAEYLHNQGFKNITVVDIALTPLNNLKERVDSFPSKKLIQADYFNLQQKFDIIVEQTFFCAINPKQRSEYVQKTFDLLKDKGKLIGVLFNFPFNDDGPPYGGSIEEYEKIFSKRFKITKIEDCYNSIKPRKGREVFIIFEKKI